MAHGNAAYLDLGILISQQLCLNLINFNQQAVDYLRRQHATLRLACEASSGVAGAEASDGPCGDLQRLHDYVMQLEASGDFTSLQHVLSGALRALVVECSITIATWTAVHSCNLGIAHDMASAMGSSFTCKPIA